MKVGVKGAGRITVTKNDTALALGSGEALVLATPRMVALIEETAWRSVADGLDEGQSTVGIHIDVHHLAATPVGMDVICETTLTEINGRKLVFNATVRDETETIGRARHERAVVDGSRFQQKADTKQAL